MPRYPSDPQVTFDELKCLISCPPGTEGWLQDSSLIRDLLDLSYRYGFGRTAQVMNWIEDIWRNPESRPKYEAMQAERFEEIRQAIADGIITPAD